MAGERLTEDSSLRDALTDEQAKQLIDWGLTHIKTEVNNTLEMEDEPAAQNLDARVAEVRKVIHQVNQMVDGWEDGDPAGRWQDLIALSQALRPLQSPTVNLESTPQIFTLGQSETPLDKDTLFTKLMSILETTP